MGTLPEKKQALYSIIEGYNNLLDRQKSREYRERKNVLSDQMKKLQKVRYNIGLIGHVKK